jgi:pimeloyl-ACP methyl ester carboxylesterase
VSAAGDQGGAVGSPIVGRSLEPFPADRGLNQAVGAKVAGVTHLIVTTIIRINTARDSERVRKMLLRDVDKTSMESFFRSIGDLCQTDLSLRLNELKVPVLGVYGRHDNIVDPRQVDVLRRCLPSAFTVMLDQSRHFPMLDEPAEFHTSVREFLTIQFVPNGL